MWVHFGWRGFPSVVPDIGHCRLMPLASEREDKGDSSASYTIAQGNMVAMHTPAHVV